MSLQPSKAQFPLGGSRFGMFSLVNELHRWKAPSPICVREFGMITSVSELQSRKTANLIRVTELGILMVLNDAIVLCRCTPRVSTPKDFVDGALHRCQ